MSLSPRASMPQESDPRSRGREGISPFEQSDSLAIGSCSAHHEDCALCGVVSQPLALGTADPPLVGWRFSAVAIGTFMAPLAVATAAAIWCQGNPTHQWFAGVLGLGVTMLLTVMIARLWTAREDSR